MVDKVINGLEYARLLREKVKNKTLSLMEKYGIKPGLAVILVGNDPASEVYVRNKNRYCVECGMNSFEFTFPQEVREINLLEKIQELNNDPLVNGILVQLPIPKHISTNRVINTINPLKDVDAFHQMNAGVLLTDQVDYTKTLLPCTPKGCLLLIKSVLGENISGKDAIVIGSSNIVGRPMSVMLLNEKCTVTVAHSKTRNLQEKILSADIVVVATGVVGLVKGDMIKPGAVVIDVGINRVVHAGKSKIVGDCEYDSCYEKAEYITPVPGGVGPMTIACLLENTLIATCNQNDVSYSSL